MADSHSQITEAKALATPSASPDPEDEDQSFLNCVVCRKFGWNLKLLPCLHHVCPTGANVENCSDRLMENDPSGQNAECPVCKITFEIDQLSDYLTLLPYTGKLENVICTICDTESAIAFCPKCTDGEFICKNCHKHHQAYQFTKNHVLTTVEEGIKFRSNQRKAKLERLNKCIKHGWNEFSKYCLECEQLLCTACETEHDSDHIGMIKTAEEVEIETRNELSEFAVKCQNSWDKTFEEASQRLLDKNQLLLHHEKDTVLMEIHEQLLQVIQLLVDREHEIRLELLKRIKDKQQTFNVKVYLLKCYNEQVQIYKNYMNSRLAQISGPELLKLRKVLIKQKEVIRTETLQLIGPNCYDEFIEKGFFHYVGRKGLEEVKNGIRKLGSIFYTNGKEIQTLNKVFPELSQNPLSNDFIKSPIVVKTLTSENTKTTSTDQLMESRGSKKTVTVAKPIKIVAQGNIPVTPDKAQKVHTDYAEDMSDATVEHIIDNKCETIDSENMTVSHKEDHNLPSTITKICKDQSNMLGEEESIEQRDVSKSQAEIYTPDPKDSPTQTCKEIKVLELIRETKTDAGYKHGGNSSSTLNPEHVLGLKGNQACSSNNSKIEFFKDKMPEPNNKQVEVEADTPLVNYNIPNVQKAMEYGNDEHKMNTNTNCDIIEHVMAIEPLGNVKESVASQSEPGEEPLESNSEINNQKLKKHGGSRPGSGRRSKRKSETLQQRQSSRSKAKVSKFDDSKELDDANEDYCGICLDGGGDLICCDYCPKVFHSTCHAPVLLTVPGDDKWRCLFCTTKSDLGKPNVFKDVKFPAYIGKATSTKYEYMYLCKFISEVYQLDTGNLFTLHYAPAYKKRHGIDPPLTLHSIREEVTGEGPSKSDDVGALVVLYLRQLISNMKQFFRITSKGLYADQMVSFEQEFNKVLSEYYPDKTKIVYNRRSFNPLTASMRSKPRAT